MTIWVSCWAHSALDSCYRPRSIRAGPVGSIPILEFGRGELARPHRGRTGLRFRAHGHAPTARSGAQRCTAIYRRLESGVTGIGSPTRDEHHE